MPSEKNKTPRAGCACARDNLAGESEVCAPVFRRNARPRTSLQATPELCARIRNAQIFRQISNTRIKRIKARSTFLPLPRRNEAYILQKQISGNAPEPLSRAMGNGQWTADGRQLYASRIRQLSARRARKILPAKNFSRMRKKSFTRKATKSKLRVKTFFPKRQTLISFLLNSPARYSRAFFLLNHRARIFREDARAQSKRPAASGLKSANRQICKSANRQTRKLAMPPANFAHPAACATRAQGGVGKNI